MGRRIEFLETLGRGGFGAVYLADVHGRDDFVQRLAVKVLSADMNLDADIAARQRDEARLLARLNHDHIVSVIDLTEVDGRPAVLMEYVEGADAGLLLRQGPIPVKAAIQIAMAAASALDAAWSTPGRSGRPLRVIHRDIKPANLLVSRHGGVKVLDFGVARAEFDREGRTGSVQFGTARFMAPEQWLYGQASHKVDIYALGVTLVELLTGMHLERAPLAPDAFARHMTAVRAAIRQPSWSDELAAGIDAVLARMLAFTPEHRPTAARVFEDLAELADLAPPPGLRRWAARAVPPSIERRRARWAADPPPPDGLLRGTSAPAPVQPVETSTAALPREPLAPTAPVGAQAPADTLATTRPAAPAARRRWLPAAVASAVTVLVLGVGGLALSRLVDPSQPTSEPGSTTVTGQPSIAAKADRADAAPPAGGDGVPGDEPAPDEGTRDPDGDVADADPMPVTRPRGTTSSQPAAATRAATATGPTANTDPPDSAPATAEAASTDRGQTTDDSPWGWVEDAPADPIPSGSALDDDRSAPLPDPPSGGGADEAAVAASPAATDGGRASDPPGAADGARVTPDDPSAEASAPSPALAAMVPISISSQPWGATLLVDGEPRGTTPVRDLPLAVGSHTLTLRYGDAESSHRITVGGRNPTSHSWTVETDEWRSSR